MQLGFSGQGKRVFVTQSGDRPGPSSHAASFRSQIWPASRLGRGSMLTLLAPTNTSPGSRPWADAAAARIEVAAKIDNRKNVRVMIPSQGDEVLYTERSGGWGKI